MILAVAAAAATFGVNHAKATVLMTHLSPPRFTRGEADESEQRRAPEAKLQQPASCERSNHDAPATFAGFEEMRMRAVE
jgi:hypothetical protein